MIISVHMPKTAGTSFATALEQSFRAKLLKDYGDFPLNTPPYERNRAALRGCLDNAEKDFGEIECIHGHFLPLKYLLLAERRETFFVTWMRNPVERVVSNYHFWRGCFNPETALPLHRKMMEEDWSLERFCLGPELKDLYAQFLYGFPLEYFAFVGITEFYEDDFQYFSTHYLKSSLEPQRLNVGKQQGRYRLDKSLKRKMEQFHTKDMDLYQRALEYRQARRTAGNSGDRGGHSSGALSSRRKPRWRFW